MVTINKKQLAGFGLLEALVALAVFGVTIVMAISLIVNSLRIIKDNEITDISNSFMVTSLEYVKSPLVSEDELSLGNYKVQVDSNGGILGVEAEFAVFSDQNCPENSPYRVMVDTLDSLSVCNQLQVELVDPSDSNSNYLVTSRIVYQLSDGFYTEEIRGFKKRVN